MATYVEFVGSGDFTGDNAGMIRDWANRDVSVLSNSVVTRCFEYGADKAYRTLRVPPLEITKLYDVNGTQEEIDAAGAFDTPDLGPSAYQGGSVLTMPTPNDLIDIVFIRNANTTIKNPGIVYNEKVDVRTFNDGYSQTKDFNFYTRVGNKIKLHGKFARGDVLEIHYYRRLPALNATYSATYNNWKAGLGTLSVNGVPTTYSASADKTESFFNARSSGPVVVNGIRVDAVALGILEAAADISESVALFETATIDGRMLGDIDNNGLIGTFDALS